MSDARSDRMQYSRITKGDIENDFDKKRTSRNDNNDEKSHFRDRDRDRGRDRELSNRDFDDRNYGPSRNSGSDRNGNRDVGSFNSRPEERSRGRNDDDRRRQKSRSRSRSRGKRKSTRSRSNESSEDEWLKLKAKRQAKRNEEEKEKEKKSWDKPPEGTELIPSIPGILNITPQLLQATMVASNPQQTRQARRLYVGNIPAGISELAIAQFFNLHLGNTGKCAHIPPVGNVQIHAEKAFAFLEFVRVEDATLCMLLDGIVFENQKVKVRRPKDYVPIPGIPSNPDDIAKDVVLPGIVSTNVKDTPFKVYLGNLPTHLRDAQVQTLVSAFGALKSFHLVTEAASSTSKGYCFFEYADTATTAPAVQ
eukprot:gene12513-26362_t